MSGTWARTRLPGVLTSATYDAANRLTAWNGAPLTYDDNGNLLTEGSRSYGWDARNRLSAVGGLQPATFGYDAFGRRVSKSAPSGTTDYLYDGVEAVQELVSGTPTANLLYGPGIDELLVRADGAGARWLVADGLGSALALLDPAGGVTTQYTYDAFGTTTATGEGSANAAQFTGRENDGTGLYYYRARYYSPRLQRFLSEDPLGFAAGDPNLYGYVGNAPTMWIDPFGLDRMDRFLDGLQTTLDAIGLVPGFEIADLFSGIISYGRGDNIGGSLSMAAMWPVGGQAATAAKAGRRFNKHAQALIELAKECRRKGGVSPEEAETLLKWAKEKDINIPTRGPEVHPNRNFDKPHIHIGPVNHIPVR